MLTARCDLMKPCISGIKSLASPFSTADMKVMYSEAPMSRRGLYGEADDTPEAEAFAFKAMDRDALRYSSYSCGECHSRVIDTNK